MNEANKFGKDCADSRALYDRLADGDKSVSSEQIKLHNEHTASCKPCQVWQSQILALSDMASALPQFDVAEALTQRILSSVETEKAKIISLERLPAMPLGVVAAVVVVLLLPTEGLQGAFSWSAGVMGLLLLQALLKSANASEMPG